MLINIKHHSRLWLLNTNQKYVLGLSRHIKQRHSDMFKLSETSSQGYQVVFNRNQHCQVLQLSMNRKTRHYSICSVYDFEEAEKESKEKTSIHQWTLLADNQKPLRVSMVSSRFPQQLRTRGFLQSEVRHTQVKIKLKPSSIRKCLLETSKG